MIEKHSTQVGRNQLFTASHLPTLCAASTLAASCSAATSAGLLALRPPSADPAPMQSCCACCAPGGASCCRRPLLKPTLLLLPPLAPWIMGEEAAGVAVPLGGPLGVGMRCSCRESSGPLKAEAGGWVRMGRGACGGR